jgi:ribbon-helix-helix protein
MSAKRVQLPLIVSPAQRAELKALSRQTRIPQQTFLREALTDLLKKYKEGRP